MWHKTKANQMYSDKWHINTRGWFNCKAPTPAEEHQWYSLTHSEGNYWIPTFLKTISSRNKSNSATRFRTCLLRGWVLQLFSHYITGTHSLLYVLSSRELENRKLFQSGFEVFDFKLQTEIQFFQQSLNMAERLVETALKDGSFGKFWHILSYKNIILARTQEQLKTTENTWIASFTHTHTYIYILH